MLLLIISKPFLIGFDQGGAGSFGMDAVATPYLNEFVRALYILIEKTEMIPLA